MKKRKLCQATKNGQYYVCDRNGYEWNPALTYCLNCGRVLKASSEGMFCDETCRLLWKTGRGGRDE